MDDSVFFVGGWEVNPQAGIITDGPKTARLEPRSGGQAYVAGAFFSESFAQAICDRFRKRRLFCTVERQDPSGLEA